MMGRFTSGSINPGCPRYLLAGAKAASSCERLGDRDRRLLRGGFACTDGRMVHNKNKSNEDRKERSIRTFTMLSQEEA